VYKEAPSFHSGPGEGEGRFRVYKEAPGFRPCPRGHLTQESRSCCVQPAPPRDPGRPPAPHPTRVGSSLKSLTFSHDSVAASQRVAPQLQIESKT
jgi:hypothetical protein